MKRVYREIRERREYFALLKQLSEQAAREAIEEAAVVAAAAPSSSFDDDGTALPVAYCIVCAMNPRDVILLTCGHVCVCSNCAALLPSNRCPVCRAHIDKVQTFFMA